MKSKKSIIILVVGLTILIRGMYMRNFFTGEEITQEMLIQEEQERMAEYLIRNYEGVAKIRFITFIEDKKTGYYISKAKIDDTFEVMFHMKGFGGAITLDYFSRDFVNRHKKNKNETLTIDDIDIEYSERME